MYRVSGSNISVYKISLLTHLPVVFLDHRSIGTCKPLSKENIDFLASAVEIAIVKRFYIVKFQNKRLYRVHSKVLTGIPLKHLKTKFSYSSNAFRTSRMQNIYDPSEPVLKYFKLWATFVSHEFFSLSDRFCWSWKFYANCLEFHYESIF